MLLIDIAQAKETVHDRKLRLVGYFNISFRNVGVLGNIRSVTIKNCKKMQLEGLAELQYLQTIQIINSGITNLDFLSRSNFDQLTHLNVKENEITSISGLENVKTLTHFYCGNNQIQQIKYLENNRFLIHFSAYCNKIKDVDVLNNLQNLKYIDLLGNDCKSAEIDCEKLTKLQVLQIRDSSVKSIDSSLKLNTVHIANTTNGDKLSFANLQYIRALSITNGGVCDLSQFSHLHHLRSLNMYQNFITSLTPIQELINLEDLNVSNNQIKHLTGIQKLKNLKSLDIGYNSLCSLSLLSQLSHLEVLRMQYQYSKLDFTHLCYLRNLTQLTELLIYNTFDENPSFQMAAGYAFRRNKQLFEYYIWHEDQIKLMQQWRDERYTPFPIGMSRMKYHNLVALRDSKREIVEKIMQLHGEKVNKVDYLRRVIVRLAEVLRDE